MKLVYTLSQLDEENKLINIMNYYYYSSYFKQDQSFQEKFNIEYLSSHQMDLHSMKKFGNSQV